MENNLAYNSARLNTVLTQLTVSAALMGIALLNFLNLLVSRAVGRQRAAVCTFSLTTLWITLSLILTLSAAASIQ